MNLFPASPSDQPSSTGRKTFLLQKNSPLCLCAGCDPVVTGTLAGDSVSARQQKTPYHHECMELSEDVLSPMGDTLGPVETCHPPSCPAPGAQELSQPCVSSVVQMELLNHSMELGGTTQQVPWQ
ncbi:hypothetical protein DV515_00008864, partial [Chloebia gouldiae]